MPLKHGLLGLLNYGDMTGYALDKAFNASLGFFWQGQMSQIYRELAAMEHSGWLTSERVIQDEKPNKKVYHITCSGKAELQNWLASPESDIADAMRIRSAFLMRVFFAGETSAEQAVQLLAAFRDACLTALASLDDASGAIKAYGAMINSEERTRYWKIASSFGESYYRAEIEWAEKAIAMLEGEG
ncbi:MAG: PadR family transcriptional regulator [Christensenellaceae bacterium]|jgi:DNA-binding PadR family transcriptional regulator|nr:PadR family transcriptional regulator [Christensenellaceae bacterium]